MGSGFIITKRYPPCSSTMSSSGAAAVYHPPTSNLSSRKHHSIPLALSQKFSPGVWAASNRRW